MAADEVSPRAYAPILSSGTVRSLQETALIISQRWSVLYVNHTACCGGEVCEDPKEFLCWRLEWDLNPEPKDVQVNNVRIVKI